LIIGNLRARYWNMETWAQRRAREWPGGPESWTVPPPWKLYFNPWQ